MAGNSCGFSTQGYNQIVIFDNGNALREIVAANPNMMIVIDGDDGVLPAFPSLFVAAVKATQPLGIGVEQQLVTILGEDELKSIGEQLAGVVRQHGLQHEPDICKLLFSYTGLVIVGWNCV